MVNETATQAQIIPNHYKKLYVAIPVFDEIGMTAIEIQLLPIIGWMVEFELDAELYERIHYAMPVCPMCDYDEYYRAVYCIDTSIWHDQRRCVFGEGKDQLLAHYNKCIKYNRTRNQSNDPTLSLV